MHWNADSHKSDFRGNGLRGFSFGLLVAIPVKQVSYVRGDILDCFSNVSASSCTIRIRIGVASCISISIGDRFCIHCLLDQNQNEQEVKEFHHIWRESSHPHWQPQAVSQGRRRTSCHSFCLRTRALDDIGSLAVRLPGRTGPTASRAGIEHTA